MVSLILNIEMKRCRCNVSIEIKYKNSLFEVPFVS